MPLTGRNHVVCGHPEGEEKLLFFGHRHVQVPLFCPEWTGIVLQGVINTVENDLKTRFTK